MNQTDKAWYTLFERYDIVEKVNEYGFYEIKAKEIKEEREPRLMAKFDHFSNLPTLFKKHKLSILPISRSSYVIGTFEVFNKVAYDDSIRPEAIPFPTNITTIDPHNLYSESSALHCAEITGMIDEVLGEEAVQTVSGRMSSKEFDFSISTKSGYDHNVSIKNAQVEIDGGYESDSQFMIVEAKKETVDDFLIRQLYYPYRLWQEQTPKKIRPVFFTHSNDIFSFFVYEFTDPSKYNSLRLIKQKDFIIAHEELLLEDILEVYETTNLVPEPTIPFPQADKFKRVVNLLEHLIKNDLTKDFITMNYDFDSRQTNYYTDAGRYLGLIEKYSTGNGVMYRLTSRGRKIMKLPYKQKYLSLASTILEHEAFRRVFHEYIYNSEPPTRERIVEIMQSCNLFRVESGSTYWRRASTVSSWINWILDLTQV
ncbi:hypothetical protein SAMN05877753_11349 [Bacillus oleivorans]|uniref:Translation elongation factor n=1 Tax=Bacillus oleivorans TaxID=1448271 RepID=A0A285D6V6_9BACI|nr:translation elongation factor [Bacillus oleivorans]SNX75549.1 hypothetical protein SAMN05877753_11349 [Bacillus oleivorans]